MIFFLTTRVGSRHFEDLLIRCDRRHRRLVVEMTYAEFVRRGRAPRGAAYVFTDRQRMSEPFRRAAIELWGQMESAGNVRLFSNPRRQSTRFGLLRRLFEAGINLFNVYRMDELELREPRYPVFLRIDDEHSGPKTDLIHDRIELERARDRLVLAGADPSRLLAAEFLDTSDERRVFRKYGTLRFGGRVICQHLLQSQEWNVKAETRLRSDATVEESDDFFRANPHAELLRPIFELSGIEYGRVDYSFLGDKVQIWEINDNPVIAGGPWRGEAPRSMSKVDKEPTWFGAFAAMAEGVPGGPDFDLDLGRLSQALRGELE